MGGAEGGGVLGEREKLIDAISRNIAEGDEGRKWGGVKPYMVVVKLFTGSLLLRSRRQ